jgi:hypothetical protein
MLSFTFTDSIKTVWLPLTALPYFLLYARDLILCGYKISDLLRVYALNLLLIPVNLAGVLKSLQQGVMKKKIPFGRTPKVQDRTAVSPLYISLAYLFFLQWVVGAGFDLSSGYIAHAVFASINAAFLLYALQTYIGYKNSWQDFSIVFEKRPITAWLLGRETASELKSYRESDNAEQIKPQRNEG